MQKVLEGYEVSLNGSGSQIHLNIKGIHIAGNHKNNAGNIKGKIYGGPDNHHIRQTPFNSALPLRLLIKIFGLESQVRIARRENEIIKDQWQNLIIALET